MFRKFSVLFLCLTLFISTIQINSIEYKKNNIKKVTIACEKSYAPFTMQDLDGNPEGLMIDFWKKWGEKAGYEVEFLMTDWSDTLQAVKNKKADIHSGLFFTKDRSNYLDFSKKIYESNSKIFYNYKNTLIQNVSDLNEEKIGVLKNSLQENYLKENLPYVKIIAFDSLSSMIEATDIGLINVFFDETLSMKNRAFMMKKSFDFKSLKNPVLKNDIFAAVQKGNIELLKDVNDGIQKISLSEWNQIEKKWITEKEDRIYENSFENYELTKEEKDWVKNRNKIKIGVLKALPPFQYVDAKGEVKGIAFEYLKIVLGDFDIPYEVEYGSLEELLKKIKNKKLDMILVAKETAERKEFLSFTKPYFFSPNVIVMKRSQKNIYSKKELKDKIIALDKKSIFFEKFKEYKNLLEVDTPIDGLLAINNNRADYYLGLEKSIDFEIFQNDLKNFKKIKFEDLPLTDLSFAVSKKNNILFSILEKGMNNRSEVQKNQIIVDYEGIKKSNIESFTKDEIVWLRNHKEIKFSIGNFGEPIEYVDKDLNYNGIISGYLNEISKILNINIVLKKTKDSNQSLNYLKKGYTNIIPAIEKNFKIDSNIVYSKSYLSIPSVIVSKNKDKLIGSLMDLNNKKVATVKNQLISSYLKKNIKDLNLIEVENTKDGIKKLNDEKIDVFIGNILEVEYFIKKLKFQNLKIDTTTPYKYEICFAVQKKYERIIPILEKSINNLNEEEKNKFYTYWSKTKIDDDLNKESLFKQFLITLSIIFLVISLIMAWNRRLTREISERITIEKILKDVSHKEKVLLEISTFLSSDVDRNQNKILESVFEKIGLFSKVEKIIFLDMDLWSSKILKVFEWQKKVFSEIDNKDLFIDRDSNLFYILTENNNVFSKNKNIKEFEKDIKNFYPQDLPENFLIIPLLYEKFLLGIMIFSSDEKEFKFSEDLNQFLKFFSDILMNFLLRKDMQKKLIESKEKADLANKAKSDFLANMSHEIRTPLNAIIGLTHLMENTNLSNKQKDYIKKINQAGYNLLGIVNDILDFSKIEAGKLTLEKIEFNLDEVIDNISNIIGIKAKDKNLELIILRESDVPIYLIGDPLRLGQVLINLGNNAVKFTNEGEISIEIKKKEEFEDEVMIEIKVEDTGIGMDEEKIKDIFAPFVQSDTSTTRKFGGTGLGLSICKKIVSMMKGQIYANCKVSQGCTFTFTAKFEKQKNLKQEKYSINEKIKNAKILLVDDNFHVLEVLRKYIDEFGLEVICKSSAQQAMNEIFRNAKEENKNYDIVFLNWKMKDMNGLELASIIMASDNIKIKPKIVMMTSYDKEELIEFVNKFNLNGVIVKPINQSTLFNVINEQLDQHYISNKDVEKPDIVKTNFEGKKILLVEDNLINQQVAKEILESRNIKVEIANDGLEAIEKLKKSDFDLILMDIQMPNLDGYETTKKIREEKLTKNPIIAMTADVMKGVDKRCYQVGMNDYISKPIDIENLFEKIESFIGGKKEILKKITKVELNYIQINGLDTREALKKLNFNLDLYKKILVNFSQEYKNFNKNIKEILNLDRQEALRYIHTIKGLSASIGALKLNENLIEFEIKVKERSETESEILIISDLIRDIISNINESIPITKEELDSIEKFKNIFSELELQKLAELKIFLIKRKPKPALDIIKSFEDGPMKEIKELKKLKISIENYDFKASIAQLELIQRTLEEKKL